MKLSDLVGKQVKVLATKELPAEASKWNKPFAVVQLEVDGELRTCATSNTMSIQNIQPPYEADIISGETERGTYYAIRPKREKLEGEFVKLDEFLGKTGTIVDYRLLNGPNGKYAMLQFKVGNKKYIFNCGGVAILSNLDSYKGKKGVFQKVSNKKGDRHYFVFIPEE